MLNIALDIIKLIKKHNQNAEVIIHETNEISVSQRLSKTERISKSKNCTIGIRAIDNKTKVAYISTNNFNDINNIVNQVVIMAKNAPEDPYISFITSSDNKGENSITSEDLNILDKKIITIDNLKKTAEIMENSALTYNKNVINSEGSSSSHILTKIMLFTASGFIGSFNKSTFINQISVIAGKENKMKVGYEYDIACNFNKLESPELIGKRAAKRAVDQLGARTIKTGRFTVVFEKRAAKELVKIFASSINGTNIISNSSFLTENLNTKIFNNIVNITDDPLLLSGVESRPFDGEGIHSKKNTFVKNGILKNWVLDLYSAKKLNLKTTGNAMRMTNATIIPAASNFYIENSNITFKELIEEIKFGIYITDLFGFGVNIINGDYSQGASGFCIENGKITYPIHEITIASNLKNMFKNMIVANDLTFCGQFNSPTIKIDEMTVAGSFIN